MDLKTFPGITLALIYRILDEFGMAFKYFLTGLNYTQELK